MKGIVFFVFCALLFALSSTAATPKLISTNAGRVGNEVITSRGVMINHLVEAALFRNNKKTTLKHDDVKNREFIRESTGVLLETAIFFEAESFAAANVSATQVKTQTRKAKNLLKTNATWRRLEVTEEELEQVVARKLRAKEFIRFKVDSATIPISDREAEDYFNNNKLKFENLPFEDFKTNIKSYLTKQQVDKRLKDWFELLQSKYRVRNYLAE